MKLVIDIGNTSNKFAIFNYDNDIIEKLVMYDMVDYTFINNLIIKYNVEHLIVSSVINDNYVNSLEQHLNKLETFIILSHNTKVNFVNKYDTISTCGTDRIAAVAGAWYKFPKEHSLIITGGTCIIYDFIDSKGNYQGGSISPGLNMRFLALSKFTSALPLITVDKDYNKLIGSSTTECILSGVQFGIQAELIGIVNLYLKKYPEINNIILNGGDTNFFSSLIDNSEISKYRRNLPNLTLEGLNAILNLNLNNE